MSKCRKRPWNLYKYKNLLLKTYSSLTTEYRMYLKILQSPRCLNWLVQNKPSATIRRVETMLNCSKDNFITKSFRLSTKRKLRIPLNFLFPCMSFIGVFSILKCKALAFKTTTSWTHASHFVDGWHLLRCQIRFFPHPLNGRHDHWTFVGEGSLGDFEVVFFSQTSGVWNFFPLYNGVRFFSGLYVMSNIFFSACFCFSQEFLCMLFSSRNQSAGYFFWNHPWTPQKWNSWPLKSTKHLLSWQILICNHF